MSVSRSNLCCFVVFWFALSHFSSRFVNRYKVLFLDVLFPQDVPKVIFMDSDQVAHADVRELYELDMRGKPLAFTPFCDSRTEMDGFRFWKQGYWYVLPFIRRVFFVIGCRKEHLHGKPYHISALFGSTCSGSGRWVPVTGTSSSLSVSLNWRVWGRCVTRYMCAVGQCVSHVCW